MAKIFIVFVLLLMSWTVFIGFTSHRKVDYLEDQMVNIIYEDIRNMERDDGISGSLNQLVIHRVVCSEQSLMYKETQNCTRMYVNEAFSIAMTNNAVMTEKTKFIQCVRRCPSIHEMCRNISTERQACADMEAMCLQLCMEQGWKKYTGNDDHDIW